MTTLRFAHHCSFDMCLSVTESECVQLSQKTVVNNVLKCVLLSGCRLGVSCAVTENSGKCCAVLAQVTGGGPMTSCYNNCSLVDFISLYSRTVLYQMANCNIYNLLRYNSY